MRPPRQRSRADRRTQLALLRRRLLAGSLAGFAALLALVLDHHVGGAAHAARRTGAVRHANVSTQAARFFDQGDGYSFSDPAPSSSAAPSPAPVAESSVS